MKYRATKTLSKSIKSTGKAKPCNSGHTVTVKQHHSETFDTPTATPKTSSKVVRDYDSTTKATTAYRNTQCLCAMVYFVW